MAFASFLATMRYLYSYTRRSLLFQFEDMIRIVDAMKRLEFFFFGLIALFSLMECNAQKERLFETKLKPVPADTPTIVYSKGPEVFFIGVDENENYLYSVGSSDTLAVVRSSRLDSVVHQHRQAFENARFVIVQCPRVEVEAAKRMIRKLDLLGVRRFTILKKDFCYIVD